ncbi:MAG: hypothetical protein ABI605_12700 [Rhizobacter sp.]
MTQRSGTWAALVGGAIAGALDINFAISFAAFNGVLPVQLLQSVASGLLGKEAYSGGPPVAVLGLAIHFAMAFGYACVFVLASRRFRWLVRHPIHWGMAYGFAVFWFMRLVVLPLSAFPHPVSFRPLSTALDLLSHMLLFGIPIAVAAKFSSKDTP